MDTNSMYFANAEVSYRREHASQIWKPVRRSRRDRARARALDKFPETRAPVDDIAN